MGEEGPAQEAGDNRERRANGRGRHCSSVDQVGGVVERWVQGRKEEDGELSVAVPPEESEQLFPAPPCSV